MEKQYNALMLFDEHCGWRTAQLDFSGLKEHTGAELKEMAVREAEGCLSEPLDHLTLSLYKSFLITGSRESYERPYFRKRRRLSMLVIAEALEERGRFLERIEEEVWSVLSEPGWVIPAHNSYIRDSPQLPVPDTGHPVIDLFAAETGEILALTHALLSSSLTPPLASSIRSEVSRRVIEPYLSSWFWWMGGRDLNNWSVWCTQNVLLAAFSLPFSDDIRGRVLKKALRTLNGWYDSYGEDGCCDEGAQYWHAAGLCFYGCLRIINEVTSDRFYSLYRDRKVCNMASYIVNMHVAGDRYINFSDCSPCPGPLGAREYLYGKAVKNKALMRLAMEDFRAMREKAEEDGTGLRLYDNDYNLCYRFLLYRYAGEILDGELPDAEPSPAFVHYPSVGITLFRGEGTVLAVKSGSNGDSHNHNDTGSLTLYSGSRPLLIDVGVETYTKKTFSPERYTLPFMQSLYHNLVNFAGTGQAAGKDHKAEVLSLSEDSISLELSGAYPEGTAGSYRRSVSFSPCAITVTESVEAAASPALSLMTQERPAAEGQSLVFDGWRIDFEGALGFEIESVDSSDARLRAAWPEKLCRTIVSLSAKLVWTVRITKELL